MSRSRRSTGNTTLAWAFGASGVAHLLLLLFGGLLPGVSGAGPRDLEPEPDERLMTFTFAPRGERDAAGPLAPNTPRPVPAEPLPVPPAPEPEPAQPAPAEGPGDAPAVEPEPSAPEAPQATSPAPGVELEDASAARLRAGETRGVPQAETAPRRLDMERALREFDDALARARERAPGGSHGGVPRHVFVPDAAALPAPGFGVGSLEFASRDYDWSDYARQIYIALWKAWHEKLHRTVSDFEKWAQRTQWDLDHEGTFRFTIERSGDVVRVVTLRPTGSAPLDASVLGTLEEVILPPLPPDFERDSETVTYRFRATGPIYQEVRRVRVCGRTPRDQVECWWQDSDTLTGQEVRFVTRAVMRQYLDAMKRAGLF